MSFMRWEQFCLSAILLDAEIALSHHTSLDTIHSQICNRWHLSAGL